MYLDKILKTTKEIKKKIWELLKEAENLSKTNDKIEKVSAGNQSITDTGLIAENSNDYFVNIGTEISNSIVPTDIPEDLIPNYENLQDLEFNDINPTLICDIIKSFQSKGSLDCDGLSTKLLKSIANEICLLIAHVFNLSITHRIFPQEL